MDERTNHSQAVELLQKLGLKEYEARAFVALARLPQGTAKEISDISDVPRTRVYDAVRVLETKGLVEIQHSNPQQFRAVDVDEAASILRTEYENRADSLEEALQGVEPAPVEDEDDTANEVWALSGRASIATRTEQLVGEAEDEIVLVIGNEAVDTDSLLGSLQIALDRGCTVVVGVVDEAMYDTVAAALPEAEVFVSEVEWLSGLSEDDGTEISRLLLVDRNTILLGTVGSSQEEHAVFGRGFDNGLVTLARRLMASGLPVETPGDDQD